MSKWKKVALWKKILIGVVIGLIIGLVSPKAAEVISPLGDIFLRMLKMLIVPLVFFSITSGVCKMGDVKQLRTVGIRYVLWIMASAVIAAIGNEFVKMIFANFLNSNSYLLKNLPTSRVGIFLETPYSKASLHFPIASH